MATTDSGAQSRRSEQCTPEKERAFQQAERLRMAEQIEHDSPEGRPAHPGTGPARISLLLVSGALIVVLIGVVGALFADPAVGIVIAVLGLVLLLFNPETWASAARAKERARIAHRMREQGKGSKRASSDNAEKCDGAG